MELKDYLKMNKISLTDLAKHIGVSRNQVSGIANKTRWPSKKIANQIIEFCESNVSIEDLNRGKPSNTRCPTCGRKHLVIQRKSNSD
jgi:transcriptional regulator with XRE-family HTH domain